VRRAMADEYSRTWLLAWRDVGPSERTFIVSPVPATAIGHTAPVVYAHGEPATVVAFTALLSTLLVDYDARQKSSRMAYFVVEQLAVLSPEVLREQVSWMGATPETWLARYAVELCYTSTDLVGLAKDANYNGPPFVWNPVRRALLQAELDAAIMHLYGLTRRQTEWILNSFSVLEKYEQRDNGEFQTMRLVLAAFDLIADVIASGGVFESQLSPPPGPPADDDSNFIPVADWDEWPPHIHPAAEDLQ
jgi:hypothetical protein